MWLIVLPFAVGILIGARLPRRLIRAASAITTTGLGLLLFTMGARVGSDPRVVSRLGVLGGEAVVIAVLSIIFSVVLVRVFVRLPEAAG